MAVEALLYHTAMLNMLAALVLAAPLQIPKEPAKDLFVHHSQIAGSGFKSLAEGVKVEYESREGAKGPEATNVTQVA